MWITSVFLVLFSIDNLDILCNNVTLGSQLRCLVFECPTPFLISELHTPCSHSYNSVGFYVLGENSSALVRFAFIIVVDVIVDVRRHLPPIPLDLSRLLTSEKVSVKTTVRY